MEDRFKKNVLKNNEHFNSSALRLQWHRSSTIKTASKSLKHAMPKITSVTYKKVKNYQKIKLIQQQSCKNDFMTRKTQPHTVCALLKHTAI
jgi:hypothetical protein